MTEPPKDYAEDYRDLLSEREMQELREIFWSAHSKWDRAKARTDHFEATAFLCLLSAVGGFLIGWTI